MAVYTKLVLLMAIASIVIGVTMAASYTVGAPGGSWDLKTDLTTWTSTNTFNVGDSLLFSYGSMHNVLEVSKTDYDSCVTSNPITSDASGSTTFSLASPTKRYFICGIPGHCQGGMKVEIDTLTTSTPPPATLATPPPAPHETPPPGVSPISPISPFTRSAIPPTSELVVPPSGSGSAQPREVGSATKSGIHINLAMGVVGIVVVFLSL